MMKKRLISLGLLFVLLSALWTPVPASASTYATVRGGWLRLRAEPSYSAYVITSYPTGTVVEVVSQAGGWCQVVTPDRRLGYMDQRYLTMGGSYYPVVTATPVYPVYPVAGWYDVNRTGYVTSQNGKGVRLRREPVVNGYNVIGLYPVGRKVTVLKASDIGWSYIRVGSQEGYMMSQYIAWSYPGGYTAAPGPATPTPSFRYTAWLTTDNGRDVYLRRDPSMNFQAIGQYPVGTQVTVLGTEGSWTRVIVNGLEGYVQSIYVTTRRPSGSAPVTTPVYYPDPTEVPYVDPDPYYPPTSAPVYPDVPGYGITSVRLTVTRPRVGDLITVVVAPVSAEFSAVWYRDDNVLLTTGNRYTVRASDVGHAIYVRVTGTGAYSGTMVEAMTSVVTGTAPTPTPVPEGEMVSEWVDELAETVTDAAEVPEIPPVWEDPTPIDSWWTGDESTDGEVISEWVDY